MAVDAEHRRLVNAVSAPAETTGPLVSIVTVALDAAATIGRTLQSVQAQTWPHIEHIVVDGGSTDGTLAILEAHRPHLAMLVSEPDRGISDAFNKGVALARGELVTLVNADDWLEPDQIEKGVRALAHTGADFAFGDLVCHDGDGRPLHRIAGDPDYRTRLHRLMPAVNHPTMLARRAVFEQVRGFEPRYRAAMDYDWLLRADRAGFRGCHVPGLVGHMTMGGISDAAFRRTLVEVRDISIVHGLTPAIAWPLWLYRLAKGDAQRRLGRILPAGPHSMLRRMVNRSHRPAG